MTYQRREVLRVVGAASATGTLAGCLGGDSDGQADTTTAATTTAVTTETTTVATTTDDDRGGVDDGPTVTVSDHPEYGEILVDNEGMTLYLFTNDSDGESVCYDSCADAWPPLTVELEPTPPESGLPKDLGTSEREDGSMQVTYDGWPLYYFASDSEPGDATGQGVNDVWFVVPPEGSDAMDGGEATRTTTEDGDGGPGGGRY